MFCSNTKLRLPIQSLKTHTHTGEYNAEKRRRKLYPEWDLYIRTNIELYDQTLKVDDPGNSYEFGYTVN